MPTRPASIVLDDFGSRVYHGRGRFDVLDARGPVFGPTHHRQRLANDVGRVGCVCYVAGHLNAVAVKPGKAHPAQAVFAVMHARHVPHAPLGAAYAWAEDYTRRVAGIMQIRDDGVIVGGPGSGNVAHVSCPAMLIEPGFISDPEYAARLRTGEGIDALGRALAQSIIAAFPEGGIVALSNDHAYRGNSDTGAPVAGAEDPAWDSEIELVGPYLGAAKEILLAYEG